MISAHNAGYVPALCRQTVAGKVDHVQESQLTSGQGFYNQNGCNDRG